MKLLTKIKYYVATLILTLCAILSPTSVSATSAAIGVSPGYENITLQPGESYKSAFKVIDRTETNEDLHYKIAVSPITISGQEYDQFDFGSKSGRNQIVDWITVDTEGGTLAPLEEKVVNFTINVPTDAAPGGQYAAIMVAEDKGDNTSSVSDVDANARFAFVIYANVAGSADFSGSIKDNSISTFSFGDTITATSLVENTGNMHTDATYILRIFPIFSDEEIYTNEEEPETHIILPESTRFVSVSYGEQDGQNAISSPGIYRVEQEIQFMNETSTTSKIVILCPMWLLLVIVFVVVFLVIWLVMRNKNRKASKSKGKSSSKSSSAHTTHSSDHEPEKPADSKPDSPESN